MGSYFASYSCNINIIRHRKQPSTIYIHELDVGDKRFRPHVDKSNYQAEK